MSFVLRQAPAPEQPDDAIALAFRNAMTEYGEEFADGALNAFGERFVADMATDAAESALRQAFPADVAAALASVLAQAARARINTSQRSATRE